ncbi:MAG: hypothetical protein QOF98_1361 [Streptomyces sp.]|nr:hypothetical protein [Streptomyces sp.]
MSGEPDDPRAVVRMRKACGRACNAMDVRPDHDAEEIWGWRGRTLSQTVTNRDGFAWMRIVCSPVGEANATFWDGSAEAEKAIPEAVPRPRLRDIHNWSEEQWQYRAELYDRVAARPASTSPMLNTEPDLPSSWWASIRTVLQDIADVPTNRLSVHQPFLDRAMPRLLGTPIDTTAPLPWSMSHGDFHWANLCAPNLQVFDWEGWGLAPTGYDAAVLHSHSLLVRSVAARVRSELAHILDTPSGRFAELVVITQLLHSTARGDNLELAGPLRARAAHLLGHGIP